jgi:hypothetical protein
MGHDSMLVVKQFLMFLRSLLLPSSRFVQCIWTASTLIAQKAWLLSAVL